MTLDQELHLNQAYLWLEGCLLLKEELELSIEFSKKEIDIRERQIKLDLDKLATNDKQIDDYKQHLREWCAENGTGEPEWIAE